MEDEEGIKFLAELLLSGYRWVKETYSDANVHLRVWLAECFGNRGAYYTVDYLLVCTISVIHLFLCACLCVVIVCERHLITHNSERCSHTPSHSRAPQEPPGHLLVLDEHEGCCGR